MNVCVILLSRLSFNKYLTPSGLPRPYVLQLKPYTKEELATILGSKLREEDKEPLDAEFYKNYAKLILGTYYVGVVQ